MNETKKLYPLTAAQKLHYFTVMHCPQKQVLNIGTSLTIETDVDFDVLRESIQEAYDRCEFMRIRFCQNEKGEALQYIIPKDEREIPFFEFGHWKYEDAENEMNKWTSVPFERYDSPMNKIVMISMPDGFKGIYLCVDHMTLDAQAIVLFYTDVIQIYCSKKYGIAYPKQLESYVKALEKDLKYAESKAAQKDRAYWYNVIESSEPIYTDIIGEKTLEREREAKNNPNLRAATAAIASCEAAIAQFHLEPNPSDVLVKFCEQYNIPMATLLLMASRTYLQKVNDNEPDVSIQNTVSRRATLLEKRSGGTRVHFFPCRTIIQTSDTFLEGCQKIQEAQVNAFRHPNFDPIEYMTHRGQFYKNEPGQTYEPMSLTYQPLSRRSKDIIPEIRYKTNWYTNGVAAQNLYLTVMHRSLDNGLDFCFEYKKEMFEYEDLQRIYYFITRILFEGVNNPNKTVGEIISDT